MTVDGGTPRTPVPSPASAVAVPDRGEPGPVAQPAAGRPRVPEATVARLAIYLRVLTGLLGEGVSIVSSEELAGASGVNSAKLRKDLSYIGSSGVRGVGYDVARLTAQVEQTLGLTRQHTVALVGVGHLGHALAGYGGFSERGFPVAALFDVSPDLVGTTIGGVRVRDVADIGPVCAELGVTIGVVATPAAAAQSVCDLLVAAGVRSILNFAPTVLSVPDDVEVRKVDLAVEMQILSFHVTRRHGTVPAAGPPGPGGAGERGTRTDGRREAVQG